MMLDYEAEQWLWGNGGYKYHCFISWPHTANKEITECARALSSSIQNGLSSIFPRPKVFLDETEMTGGDAWERRLKDELCKSIAMIAVCAPIYYHPEHKWCGLEWAAMESLSDRRLRGKNYKSIIPVMVRKSDILPTAVSRIQYIDFSRVTLRRGCYSCREFQERVEQIVERVREIIIELGQSRIRADCEQFSFPSTSAFADYATPEKDFPLVGGKLL